MRQHCRLSLLAAVVGAATISACSDSTAPVGSARSATGLNESAVPSFAVVDAASLTPINVPGATTTLAFGINNDGVIVGRYVAAGRTHGFMRTPDGEFTTIDFPGAGFTVASALNNDGDVVGWYTLPSSSTIRHGYLLRDGEFTSFDPAGSRFTNTLGINDRGDIVGRFCTLTVCREPGSGDFHGFLLRNGEFTTLDVPGSNETNTWKINDRQEILAGFGPAGGGVQLSLSRKGDVGTFTPPAGKFFSEDNGGLNARGDFVGKYCDASPCVTGPNGHGFANIRGSFTTIDVPGARGTAAFGINNQLQVVGGYFDSLGVLHGYLLRLEMHG